MRIILKRAAVATALFCAVIGTVRGASEGASAPSGQTPCSAGGPTIDGVRLQLSAPPSLTSGSVLHGSIEICNVTAGGFWVANPGGPFVSVSAADQSGRAIPTHADKSALTYIAAGHDYFPPGAYPSTIDLSNYVDLAPGGTYVLKVRWRIHVRTAANGTWKAVQLESNDVTVRVSRRCTSGLQSQRAVRRRPERLEERR